MVFDATRIDLPTAEKPGWAICNANLTGSGALSSSGTASCGRAFGNLAMLEKSLRWAPGEGVWTNMRDRQKEVSAYIGSILWHLGQAAGMFACALAMGLEFSCVTEKVDRVACQVSF